MKKSITFCGGVIAALLMALPSTAQLHPSPSHPNLVEVANGMSYKTSSAKYDYDIRHLLRSEPERHWESVEETQGAWILFEWEKPQTIREFWIVSQSAPYDLLLEPFMLSGDYLVPSQVTLTFSDGSTQKATLRLSQYTQIFTLPTPKTTTSVRITVDEVWPGSGQSNNTGIGKFRAFASAHQSDFKVTLYDMYEVHDEKAVQSAKIEILNPGEEITGATVNIVRNKKLIAKLPLERIPARSVTTQQLWVPAPFESENWSITLSGAKSRFTNQQQLAVIPYQKNHFDGGVFQIIMANHNDLGFLDTQFWTADYRSRVLIGPALDLMKEDPDFSYNMEAVEYLKEFLVRHPERRQEIEQRMREGRFSFGSSYVLNLQSHVGQEKLVRQFYLGRRWLIENFPGCDTRYYMNVDVPQVTYQMPQILKKSGIDYMVQGRFPWGFYYWKGLDGTHIPMFALRYTSAGWLLNPVNNTGWLRFQNIRNDYYQEHNLPKQMIYDFNCDYLPPAPQMIPYVKNQNREMKEFASVWNKHYQKEPEKQITPPSIEYTLPMPALDRMFGQGELEVQTIRGEWPNSWAYFDEPGHRDGLLMGRQGHNQLLKAEGMFAWLQSMENPIPYPAATIEEGWLANCWPDHGWGGHRGNITDSINVASYRTSLSVGNQLVDQASQSLKNRIPAGKSQTIPVVVYNSSSWERTDLVTADITYPSAWSGFEVVNLENEAVAAELISTDRQGDKLQAKVLFLAAGIPSMGYRTFYIREASSSPQKGTTIAADSIENDYISVKFGKGGISSLYDKVGKQEVLRTDKFAGGEVLQFTAPGVAWNEGKTGVTTEDFDKTSNHEFKTIRATESPVRFVIEKEAQFQKFTLRERFILHKHAREVIVEADILNWNGEKARELRLAFPMNEQPQARISYEIPFGTVEMGRDEIDYSQLHEAVEVNFVGDIYARNDLPFREAINWVDVSSGEYLGKGCLLASDVTLHLFRDESDHPVDYPIVQHVLLSSRESLGWLPHYSFAQEGSHTYRAALYPHAGNWRFAYREGRAFNEPFTAITGELNTETILLGSGQDLETEDSFLSIGPKNLIISAAKGAEDGQGVAVRFYEAEGKYSQARLKGFKPFSKVWLTNMLEYNQEELAVEADGSVTLSVSPWEIVTLRVQF